MFHMSFTMPLTLVSTLVGRSYFSARLLPSNGSQAQLSICEFLVLDHEQKSISVASVLGFPTDLPPGEYEVQVEPRGKSGGRSGMSLWYLGAKPRTQSRSQASAA